MFSPITWVVVPRRTIFFRAGDSRKSRSRESRRKRQRAVSLPPHLRTITEQRSLEETEEVACSRQPRSPIQVGTVSLSYTGRDRLTSPYR